MRSYFVLCVFDSFNISSKYYVLEFWHYHWKIREFYISIFSGDNMLTALSVARDCQMLESCDKTILVQVVPPSDSQDAYIEWNYAEYAHSHMKQTPLGNSKVRYLFDKVAVGKYLYYTRYMGHLWVNIPEYIPAYPSLRIIFLFISYDR